MEEHKFPEGNILVAYAKGISTKNRRQAHTMAQSQQDHQIEMLEVNSKGKNLSPSLGWCSRAGQDTGLVHNNKDTEGIGTVRPPGGKGKCIIINHSVQRHGKVE